MRKTLIIAVAFVAALFIVALRKLAHLRASLVREVRSCSMAVSTVGQSV